MEFSYSQIVKNSFVSLTSGAAIGALLSNSWEGAAVGAIANLGIVEDQQASTHAKVTALFAAAKLGCILLNVPKEWVPFVGLALNATMDNATRMKIALTTTCMFFHTGNYVNDLAYSISFGKMVTEVGRLWAHSPRALYNEANFLFLPIGILINRVWQYQSAILGIYSGFREIQQSYLFPSRIADSLSLVNRGDRHEATRLIIISLSKMLFWNVLSNNLMGRAFNSKWPFTLKSILLVAAALYATYTNHPRLGGTPSSSSETPAATWYEIEHLRSYIARLEKSLDPLAPKWLAAASLRLKNLTG